VLLRGAGGWIDDCRLPIEDWEARSGAVTHRNVKYEDRTDYVYENTGSIDKIADNQPGFLAENVRISRKWTTIDRAFGRKCTGYAKIRGEGGPKIGSPAGRSIEALAEHQIGFRWPDDPTIR
jgi:hypothetical protein